MDVGGTNLRIGTVSNGELKHVEQWLCAELSGPTEALTKYLTKYPQENITLCMAIASPIKGDNVVMTNLNWSFSRDAFQKEFDLRQIEVINDYHAMCFAIPALTESDKIQIGGGSIDPHKPAVVCGPGTGLGVATAIEFEGRVVALPGEGGHMDFAPASVYEQEIWQFFHARYGHVSYERLLSGPGLVELHEAICALDGVELKQHSAAQIGELGSCGESASCRKALDSFCAMLGSFCGSLALHVGAFGGVYIGGGIAPKLADIIARSDFRERFEAKGRYQSYNAKIPTFVITTACPGLLGAAEYFRQKQP